MDKIKILLIDDEAEVIQEGVRVLWGENFPFEFVSTEATRVEEKNLTKYIKNLLAVAKTDSNIKLVLLDNKFKGYQPEWVDEIIDDDDIKKELQKVKDKLVIFTGIHDELRNFKDKLKEHLGQEITIIDKVDLQSGKWLDELMKLLNKEQK